MERYASCMTSQSASFLRPTSLSEHFLFFYTKNGGSTSLRDIGAYQLY